ncbi:hypothetical protein GCM10010468_75610 [Actinocorallia longicatena]|uniref:Uncharacterized protein n=1 Tax=Actinocorallia longicatena TaxID=111803 RepID=A0ABP6QMP1_9ACTN
MVVAAVAVTVVVMRMEPEEAFAGIFSFTGTKSPFAETSPRLHAAPARVQVGEVVTLWSAETVSFAFLALALVAYTWTVAFTVSPALTPGCGTLSTT